MWASLVALVSNSWSFVYRWYSLQLFPFRSIYPRSIFEEKSNIEVKQYLDATHSKISTRLRFPENAKCTRSQPNSVCFYLWAYFRRFITVTVTSFLLALFSLSICLSFSQSQTVCCLQLVFFFEAYICLLILSFHIYFRYIYHFSLYLFITK